MGPPSREVERLLSPVRDLSHHRTVTPRRKKIALVVAALADTAQLGFLPVFWLGGLSLPDDVLDLAVAVVLAITMGWSWRLAIALAIELVPGVALFPSWTAFVAMMPGPARARAREVVGPTTPANPQT
jgi:hypothetical protein